MDRLPSDCILDKGRTGCGATTLAIRQQGNTIITVPYVNLIKSKESQHGDILLGVYEGTGRKEILDYAKSHGTHKIMVTYDSLPKVIDILTDEGYDVLDDYQLVIDEWQVILNSYDFRPDAMQGLLKSAERFKDVIYMTATPVKRKYMPDEMKHFQRVKIQWQDEQKLRLHSVKTTSPARLAAELCEGRTDEYNLHIFVNSVTMISRIIKYAGLKPDDVRIVCSKNRESIATNQSKLGNAYRIADITDPVKPYNFYTSTAFEGCDIYDEKGLSVIVNDGHIVHSLLPVDTLFFQIAGRLRDSRYRDYIINIFSTTRKTEDVTYGEYVEASEKAFKEAEEYSQRMNGNNTGPDLAELYTNKRYVRVQDRRMIADRNMLNCDLMKHELQSVIYGNWRNLIDEIRASGIKIVKTEEANPEKPVKESASRKASFKDAFKRYCELKSASTIFPSAEQILIEKNKPLVKTAYDTLGESKVISLKYKVTDIRRELVKASTVTETEKIIRMVRQSLPYRKAIPRKEIAKVLQGIYDTLGIHRIAVATDLAK